MRTPIRLPVPRVVYERHHYTIAEIRRLHALPDRFLAEELLRLCRGIRKALPSRDGRDGYNGAVLWDVVPEVAYRLGARLELNESTEFDLKRAVGQDFRDYVAICMVNVARSYMSEAETDGVRDPLDILFHDAANGNPVAMALDRLVPPTPHSTDRFARTVREVSRNRGMEETGVWSPALNERTGPKIMELVIEDEPVPAPRYGM